MKIQITAKPKSKKAYVKQIDATHYIVAVHEAPVQGKANQAILRALADYFKVSMSQVCIVQGQTAKKKVVDVPLTIEELRAHMLQPTLV